MDVLQVESESKTEMRAHLLRKEQRSRTTLSLTRRATVINGSADGERAESKEGRVRVADKKDLIRLKRARDSKQDQADIERLENDEVR